MKRVVKEITRFNFLIILLSQLLIGNSVYSQVSGKHFDLFVNSELSYYVTEHTQLICGLRYYNNFYHNSKSDNSLLNIHPGLAYETGDNFLIVINSPVGLYGKNEIQCY